MLAIEQTICTIKERIYAIANQLPLKTYPHRLIVEMVYDITFWLNAFPHKDGVHDIMSPCTIITGLKIDQNKHCQLEFRHMCRFMKNTTIYSRHVLPEPLPSGL